MNTPLHSNCRQISAKNDYDWTRGNNVQSPWNTILSSIWLSDGRVGSIPIICFNTHCFVFSWFKLCSPNAIISPNEALKCLSIPFIHFSWSSSPKWTQNSQSIFDDIWINRRSTMITNRYVWLAMSVAEVL